MTGLTLLAYFFHFGFFEGLERQSVDLRFSMRGSQGAPKDVVVVGIDAATLQDFNIRPQELRRSFYAKFLNRIHAANPKVVAIDIQFTSQSRGEKGPVDDNALVTAVSRFPHRVVLSTVETDVDKNGVGHTQVFGGDGFLRSIGAVAANGSLPTDPDGKIRSLPYEVGGLKSFSVVSGGLALGHPITKSDVGGSKQWIDFPGPDQTVTTYSLSRASPVQIVRRGSGAKPWKVITGGGLGAVIFDAASKADAEAFARKYNVPLSSFRDKIVVLGATHPALQDIHPTSSTPAMAGPEIQADAIYTALHGFPLRSLSTVWNLLLIVFFGFLVPLASLRVRPMVAVAIGLLAGAVFVPCVLILAFNQDVIVSFVYPLAALILSTVGAIAVHYVVTSFEKERVRDVFSRFVPETVVEQVLTQADADLRIGGREVVGTVMFSDLRGFTSSAEYMPAEKVIHVLNHYLHEMSEAILAHGGTLLCYMGDGIYALFGAPLDQDDHADRALAASREMLTERLPAFNEFMQAEGLGEGYFMGVGLNTGPVMTGNVGHERRMDYTAVGDIVNTASRIEGMTKETPFSVLIAESTVDALQERPSDILFYEEQAVRGRKEALRLYALDIRKQEAAPAAAASPSQIGAAPTEAPAPAPASGA
jgi:adenylate cyclase